MLLCFCASLLVCFALLLLRFSSFRCFCSAFCLRASIFICLSFSALLLLSLSESLFCSTAFLGLSAVLNALSLCLFVVVCLSCFCFCFYVLQLLCFSASDYCDSLFCFSASAFPLRTLLFQPLCFRCRPAFLLSALLV